jgi:hypothetical protein
MATRKIRYAICLRNDDCVDLEVRKVYRVLPDDKSAHLGLLRVVDESGEDYLYPEKLFAFVEVPVAARRVISGSMRA